MDSRQDLSRRKKLYLNTVSSLVLQVTTIICGFILPRMILKYYGSEVNGLVASVNQFLSIISFLELGVGAVIQASLYRPLAEGDKDQISKISVSGQRFFTNLAKILLIYLVFLLIFYPRFAKQEFSYLYTAGMILVMSISSFAQYYFGILNSLIVTADQRGYISTFAQIITIILNTLVCIILMVGGAEIHLVKLSTSLIYALRPIFLSWYVKKNYDIDWKISYDEEPIKQKRNGMAQHIAAVVLDGTDILVLTIFSGMKEVSIYSLYYLVVKGVRQVVVAFTNGSQALMGDLRARQELDHLKKFFSKFEWSIHTMTSLLFGITSILIVPFIMVYTSGTHDANYNQPLFARLLVLALACYCLRLPYNTMILSAGHFKQTQNNYIIAALINVILSVISVKRFGLVGVTVGTLIAMTYQTIRMARYNSKNFIHRPLKKFFKQVLVDILIVVIIRQIFRLPFFSGLLAMKQLTLKNWLIMAIEVSLLSILVSFLVNMIFYRDLMRNFLKKIF